MVLRGPAVGLTGLSALINAAAIGAAWRAGGRLISSQSVTFEVLRSAGEGGGSARSAPDVRGVGECSKVSDLGRESAGPLAGEVAQLGGGDELELAAGGFGDLVENGPR